jgi:hypothetical protein
VWADYAFTMIGVGGVVLNERGEVLLVQERFSPSARMQGSWKVRLFPHALSMHGSETLARSPYGQACMALRLSPARPTDRHAWL